MFKKFFPVGYIILLGACSKTEMNQPSADQHYDDAEFHTAALNFSGYTWQVRNTANIISGPGGNYFSKKPSMVFVDENGDLHLNIKKINNKWRCSEVYLTATTGYGKYIFVTKGELETYNEKIVAGLFTWDNFS
ncbi:MAG: hypothetical protein H7X71_05600, partial [Chitinophagales bacterium]|nr:hypothetical protein [Chitinophagales bacterium]